MTNQPDLERVEERPIVHIEAPIVRTYEVTMNQPDLSAIPAKHLPRVVAGAWRPCEEEYGIHTETCWCKGTGRIYALPETVRLTKHNQQCPGYDWGQPGVDEARKHLPNSICLGYQLSTDLTVWIRVALQYVSGVGAHLNDKAVAEGRALEVVLRALAQALVAENWNLGEVPDA